MPLDLVVAVSVLGIQATPDDQITARGWVVIIIFATVFVVELSGPSANSKGAK